MPSTASTARLVTLLAAFALALPVHRAGAEEGRDRVDLPAQPLDASLSALAAQSRLELLYDPALTAGKAAPAVSGELTTAEALGRLLAGTGLEAKFTAPGKATLVVAPPPPPKAGAALAPQRAELEEVGVTAEGEHGYAATAASAGTKTATPLMSTPVAVEVLPQQLLREQGLTSSGLTSALATLGVQTLGMGEQGEVLIFRGFSSWTTLWNGFRIEDISTNVGPINGGVWMETVDRLEVLKGPASILYGRAEPGGAVNVLTRKPQAEFQAALNAGVGSWSDRWVGADVTGPIDEGKTLLYRVNLAMEDSGSWYRWGPDYRSRGVAPALAWRITPQTTLSVEGQYRSLEGRSGQAYIPIDPATGRPLPVAPRDTLLPGGDSRFDQRRTLVSLDHRFDASWSASWRYLHNDARNPRSGFVFVLGSSFPVVDGSLETGLMVGFNQARQRTDATILDVTGHVTAFGARHTLLLGADYYDRSTEQVSGWDFSQTTDYFNPTPPAPVAGTDTWDIAGREYALYLQDQVELPGRWHLLLGLRYQGLDEHSVSDAPSLGIPAQDVRYRKDVLLPRLGLLWQPRPWLSTYYGYAENMGANTGLDFTGKPLKPEWARQHELGVKGEWWDGRLNALVALFQLTKTDLASDDPAHPGFNIGVGEVRSTGLELNVQGALTDRWNLLANYSHARPHVVKGTTAATIYSGPTIVAGQDLPYVSNHTFSAWTSYRLPGKVLAGWTVGGGFNWASAANPQDGATVKPKASQVASAFVAHERRLAGHKFVLQLNASNLFDERYLQFQGDDVAFGGNTLGGNWGTPRQFRLSLRAEY